MPSSNFTGARKVWMQVPIDGQEEFLANHPEIIMPVIRPLPARARVDGVPPSTPPPGLTPHGHSSATGSRFTDHWPVGESDLDEMFPPVVYTGSAAEIGVELDLDVGLDGDHEAEFSSHQGRKKRKTPASQMTSGRHEGFAVYDGDVKDGTDRHHDLPPILPDSSGDDSSATPAPLEEGNGAADEDTTRERRPNKAMIQSFTPSRKRKPVATQTCEFRKLQFLRRKAALITLFLDATSAIKSYWKDDKTMGTINKSKNLLSKLPEVDSFEKLLPALEDMGVGEWPADHPGWRKGTTEGDGTTRWGVWRTKFAKRRKIREERTEIVRGGWAPEGSFEFENPTKAGAVAREGAKARAGLQRLAQELRDILLSLKPKASASTESSHGTSLGDGSPPKSKHRTGVKTLEEQAKAPQASSASSVMNSTTKTGGNQLDRTASNSKDGSDVGSGAGPGGKKKPKKKKRSAKANQSNPHHVDNYRPTRTINTSGDPNEPYPHHASLLFPPSMSFLSARPNGRQRVRPSEDEFICCFCEYDLLYGSEQRRKAAIRRRKQELKRKENIKNKAKSVAEGKGKLNDDNDGSEYEEGEEDEVECEDDGFGKCSCGRSLGPHGDKADHLKPPDPDPNKSPIAHVQPPPSMLSLPGAPVPAAYEDEVASRASTPSID